jgi:hypothetical protein
MWPMISGQNGSFVALGGNADRSSDAAISADALSADAAVGATRCTSGTIGCSARVSASGSPRVEIPLATPSLKWGNQITAPNGSRANQWSYFLNSAGSLIMGEYKLFVGIVQNAVWTRYGHFMHGHYVWAYSHPLTCASSLF